MSTKFREPGDDRNDDYWYNFGYGALDLSVEQYRLDDHDPGTHGLEESELRLDDVAWDTLTLEGTVTIPDGLVDYVFEDGVDPARAGTIIVRGDCNATHNRFVADEIDDFTAADRATFRAEIDRTMVADSIELEPVLVRIAPETTGDFRYGQTPGLKLADGPTFEVDPEGDEDDGSFLPVETKEFEDEREDHIFYLDHSVASDPKLYINSNVNLLVPAYQSRAPYGAKRWMRETLERLVGQPVWVELVLWTATDITDGECQYEWQEEVIEILADVEDQAPEEVAERLETQIAEPDRVDTLVESTNEAVQELLEIDDALESLLEEVL